MYPEVLVEVVRVVDRDALKALEIRRKLVELRESAAALLLDAYLDLANPAALQLDALCDNLLLEAGE